MCGIVGALNYRATDEQIKNCHEAIWYRGPDGFGVHKEDSMFLAHRRLAIIDLYSGMQPMYNEKKDVVIVFNGEIFNYLEIRKELQDCGHVFATESDTEVIIHAYEEWGMNCLRRFNGMWAFAIWDSSKKKLFIARDRLGIKPLFYKESGNKLIFGSEIKALFPLDSFVPDYTFLDVFLAFGYIPGEHTFYKGVKKLLPGYYIEADDSAIRIINYWDVPWQDETAMNARKRKVNERFNELFNDAVRIRLVSDVPFGAFLSGGLDSSSVVSCMAKHLKSPVKTFTIGFDSPDYDERILAREVSRKFKTEHFEKVIVKDAFDDSVKKMLIHFDEPFGDSSALAVSIVARHAAEKVKMVLTGDGGDEVLSGYPGYQVEKAIGLYHRIPLPVRQASAFSFNALSRCFSGSARLTMNRWTRLLYSSSLQFNERLLAKAAWFDQGTRERLLKGCNKDFIPALEYLDEIMKPCPYQDGFYRMMYFHLKFSLPDDMLTKVDRMTMASSIEARVPLLDYRLVEYMAGVHKNVKMNGYERKSVLRNSVTRSLPKKLLQASKKGFAVPLKDWFKEASLEAQLNSIQNTGSILNRTAVSGIIEANREGRVDFGNAIWMLILLRKWEEQLG